MRSIKIKSISSVAIVLLIVAAVPAIGFTQPSVDAGRGLVLDFGYWNIEWIEMAFTEGMDGDAVLDRACESKGYEVTRLADGSVYSVNGQVNLVGVKWAMYVLSGTGWARAEPKSVEAEKNRVITWARSSGEASLVPATDYSGFSYYGYAKDGMSAITGKKLSVVTLAPSVTETVASVKGIDHIIGTDLYSNYPKMISDKHASGDIAITGGYTDPNYEWIIKLAPDLVFCDGSVGQQVVMADKLRKSGVGCVVLYDATDVSAMFGNIWITASALGLSANANSTIRNLRSAIDTVSGIAGETGKRVFVSLSADPSPWTSGSHTFMSDIVSSAGGKNIFDSQSSSWFMVSKEQIYAKQPQVIIIIMDGRVNSNERYREIVDGLDPVWKETPAYRNGDVFLFTGPAGDILSRPGPRLAEAVELLSKVLNPEAFTEKDPLDAIPKYFSDDYQSYLIYQKEVFT
ncbi:MAG: ABC transporter substrate-binding protein [Candidatus Methanomethylophilaceae archaeon]|nr:ABC transporter substrate-binding protein [Candidatus Methanomethylophilaceae archaeon]